MLASKLETSFHQQCNQVYTGSKVLIDNILNLVFEWRRIPNFDKTRQENWKQNTIKLRMPSNSEAQLTFYCPDLNLLY